MSTTISITAIEGIPEIRSGDNLSAVISSALRAQKLDLHEHDIIVVAQKIVSKAEGRTLDLRTVTPSPRALALARETRKDARLVEVILSESQEVIRVAPDVLIVRHRLGFVMANAGIDQSNVPSIDGEQNVLLLPTEPDVAARFLRVRLEQDWQCTLGIIISDSFGRPWRNGVVNVAIGAAGLPSLIDRRGEVDRSGRKLEMTEVAFADAIAAGAALAMGEAAEGVPVARVRGLVWQAQERDAAALVRPLGEDLFR